MLRRKYLLLLFLLISGAIFPTAVNAGEEMSPAKKVLVIHSYNPEYEWVSNISRGIKRIFESEKDVVLETLYLDAKKLGEAEKLTQAGNRAREIISQWDPDIVITVDDTAQKYVGKYYAGRTRPKVVFCGVSLPIENYGYPAANVTGVMETSTLKSAVEFLDQRITPVKSISIIGDDSPDVGHMLSYAKNVIEKLGKKVVSGDIAGTFSQWKSKISGYQRNKSDAILVVSCDSVKNDTDGRIITAKETMEWTSSISEIPVFGIKADIVDNGALLGVTTSGLEHGKEAAMMALGLLKGKSIDDYPVKTVRRTIVLLNRNTAEHLGIPMIGELLESVDVLVGD